MMMNDEKTAPIFVVGTPRSGTTLAAKILGRHSRIFMPGETHFFDDILARRSELGELPEEGAAERILARLTTLYDRYNEPADQQRIDLLFSEPSHVASLKEGWRSYKDVFASFMNVQARQAGKARWGNNAPRDLFNVREILEFFPDAKFIICVRDVRDFLLSYQNKWQVSPSSHKKRLKRLYHPILTSLLWKSSMRQMLMMKTMVPENNFIVLRYEDLVLDPDVEVRKMCDLIGENFESGMLKVKTHNSSFASGDESGIFASSIGRWKQQLGKDEAWWAQFLNRKELKWLGYPLEDLNPKPWMTARWVVTIPVAVVRTLEANKRHRGGTIAYLAKRVALLVGKQPVGHP